jgi:hypothetical protein
MMNMTRSELTNEEIRDILCAPLPTDALEDIGEEDEFDPESEAGFIESSVNEWLEAGINITTGG